MLLFVLRCPPVGIFPQANFNSTDHARLVVDATTFASRPTANETFVNFNGMFTPDSVALWPTMPARSL